MKMSRILPILFNTDMVRAILDGNKTVTRRCVRYKYSNTEMKMRTDKYGTRLIEIQKDVEGETFGKNPDGSTWHKLLGYIELRPPYQMGDILYVRETWCRGSLNYQGEQYYYKADNNNFHCKWRPSIHMPKEAARIWLKVTNVRVERLQDITIAEIIKEGCSNLWIDAVRPMKLIDVVGNKNEFTDLWNSTIKKSDLDRYGWTANPWVWVIEFERCEKPNIRLVNRKRDENNKMTKWLEGMRKI